MNFGFDDTLLARAEELLRDRDRVLNDLIKSSVFTEEECKNLDLVKLPESHEFLKRIESLVNKFTNTVEIPVDNRYYYESALPNVQNPKNQAPPPKNVDNDLKLLFVDVDGTLTETLSGSPFKQSPDDIKPIEGAHSDRDEDKQCAHNVNIPFMPAQDWWR
jgi:hypothetical protein